MANTKQVGAWYGINRSYPMQTEQQDVLSLWLDHGVGLTDGHYAYTLMPCADPDRLARYIAHPTAVILANTTELQAVWHSSVSMLQAAFWSAGEVRPDKQMTVSVDHPCILLAQRTSGGIHLAVSDPTQSLSKVRVSVTGHFRGDHCTWDSVHKRTEILVDFPINAEAGRSVLQELLKVE